VRGDPAVIARDPATVHRGYGRSWTLTRVSGARVWSPLSGLSP